MSARTGQGARARCLWQRYRAALLVTVLAWAALALAIHNGGRIHPAVVPGIAAAALGWTALRSAVASSTAFPVAAPPEWAPLPGDRRLADLTWDVRICTEDEGWRRRMRPWLTGLISDRLSESRGIDAAHQPEAAREALGDELWAVVDGTAEHPRSTRAVTALIERIEKI